MIRSCVNNTKQQVYLMLASSLLLLYFAITYMGMYSTTYASESPATNLARFLIATIVTYWLYLRFQRSLDSASIWSMPTCHLLFLLLDRMARPCCVTMGILLGGYFCIRLSTSAILGWIIGGCIGMINPVSLVSPQPEYSMRLLRGTFILSLKQIQPMLLNVIQAGETLLLWAGLPLPERFSADSFFILGAIGSGKTVLLRMLLQSIVCRIRRGSDWRCLVYDAKQDAIGLIMGMAIQCRIIILNPFDKRSYAWDIAKDINSPSAAMQLASLIIPKSEKGGDNEFFTLAARDLVAAVVQAFILTRPREWTLAELLLTLASREKTERLLQSLPQTRHIADEHFSRNERTLTSVQYTITAYTSEFRTIAALYENCDRKFSLQEWLTEESILVLGNDERLRTSIDAINKLLFNRITELLLSQSESDSRRSWIVMDEIKEASRFASLGRLISKGRSKGVRTVLASQTVEGMHETYGDKLGEDIMSMCGHKAFLRTDSPQTSQWCAKVIGDAEVLQSTQSFTRGKNNNSTTVSDSLSKKEAVLPSQLMRLPRANRRRFYGYYTSPGLGVFSGPVYFARALYNRSDEPNFIDRPVEDQYLTDEPGVEEINVQDEIRLEDIPPMTAEIAEEVLENDDS